MFPGSSAYGICFQGEKSAVYTMLSEKIELIGEQEKQMEEKDGEIAEASRNVERLQNKIKALERQVAVTSRNSMTLALPHPAVAPQLSPTPAPTPQVAVFFADLTPLCS